MITGAKNAAKTGNVPSGIVNEYGPEAGLARAEAAARANGTTVPIGARAAAEIGQTDAKHADPDIRKFAREPVNNPLHNVTNQEIERAVDIPLNSNTQTAGDLTSLAATNDPRAKTVFKGQYSEVASTVPHGSPPSGDVKTAAAPNASVGQGTTPGALVEATPKVAKSQASLTQAAKTEQAAATVAQRAKAETTPSQAAKLEQAASKGVQVVKAESTAAKVVAGAGKVVGSCARAAGSSDGRWHVRRAQGGR